MFGPIETPKLEVFKSNPLGAMRRLRDDERGVTAMEYGLIAALIGVAAVAAMNGVGGALIARLNQIATALRP